MFDSKFIATLFAVAISVFAICNINTNRITSNEGFGFGGLPSTTRTKSLIACPSMEDYNKGNCVSVPSSGMIYTKDKREIRNIGDDEKSKYEKNLLGQTVADYAQRGDDSDRRGERKSVNEGFYFGQNMNGYNKGQFFSTENFQANLSPRFDNSGHGPYVRETFVKYGQPSIENLAVPTDPMGYADMVGGGCSKKNVLESYGAENSLMIPNYSEGNYNSLSGGNLLVTSDLLPVQNMSALNGVDKNGQPTQCIFFERIIHSNRNNRRRSQGDPIRGDLPIAPINNGWFNTSTSIYDLQQGALGVIGGMSDSSTKMADFINESSGMKQVVGGVDTEKIMSTNQQMNTVQVSR